MKPIISKNCRYRLGFPNETLDFIIGNDSIIDDYSYFSTRVEIGMFSHIASNVTIAGGRDVKFTCGSFGGLASGVRVFCASDNFIHDIGNVLPENMSHIKNSVISGDIILEDYVTVGANSVIMPKTHIPIGTMIGAMSFVSGVMELKPWSVYVTKNGRLRKIADRNKDNVLRQSEEILKNAT